MVIRLWWWHGCGGVVVVAFVGIAYSSGDRSGGGGSTILVDVIGSVVMMTCRVDSDMVKVIVMVVIVSR